jgi:hypothetical protein
MNSVSEPVLAVLFGLASSGHPQASNAPPALSIYGAPAQVARTDSFYAFTPTVFQRGERALRFSVENKPSWLSFGSRRGTLYGTPHAANAGTYSNIVITVSDGTSTVRLPAFAIQVPAAATPMVAGAR